MIDILPPRKTQGVGNMLRDGALALAAGVVLFVAHEIVESAYEAPAANESMGVWEEVDDFAMRNADDALEIGAYTFSILGLSVGSIGFVERYDKIPETGLKEE